MQAKKVKFKEIVNKAKNVGKSINKSFIFVLFDMFKSSLKYKSSNIEYFDFEFYLLDKNERATYLTKRSIQEIVNKYNKKEDFYKLDNKIEFNKLFRDYLERDYINLKEVSFKEFKDFIADKDKIVVKRPESSNKNDDVEVIILDKTKLKNEFNVLKIYNGIMKNEQYLVEEYLVQNKELSKLYSDSVNSLRFITFVDDNGKVQVLNTFLMMGKNGNVDKFDLCGLYTFVDDNGKVNYPAIDKEGNTFAEHPAIKTNIMGYQIPNYESARELVKKLALKVSTVRYVEWSIAVTENGVAVIDANSCPQVFQMKPSVNGNKIGDLVKYREYMDI